MAGTHGPGRVRVAAVSTETRRLLVGLDHSGEMDEPRRYLVDLITGLGELGVEVRVALFSDGPVREVLEDVAQVMVVPTLRHRSPGGVVQSLVRRISPSMAESVHHARTSAVRRWIGRPDGILVHGPRAAPLLGYLRDETVPVAVYAHPWDFSVAGVATADRQRLLRRASRFLAAEPTLPHPGSDRGSVIADLLAAGARPDLIEPAPDPLVFPDPPRTTASRRAARRRFGIDGEATAILVPPVADWCDSPDLTLALVWELERRPAADASTVVWYGMPSDGEPRWSVAYDVDRMGLTSVRILDVLPSWETVLDAADLVVLPIRSTFDLPHDFALAAARRGVPLLCWAGHPRAAEVDAAHGVVVDRGDVEAMADAVAAIVAETDRAHRVWHAGWLTELSELDRVAPLALSVP